MIRVCAFGCCWGNGVFGIGGKDDYNILLCTVQYTQQQQQLSDRMN